MPCVSRAPRGVEWVKCTRQTDPPTRGHVRYSPGPLCWMTRRPPSRGRAKCRRSLRWHWYLSGCPLGTAYRPQTLETWRQSGIDNGLCRLVPFSLVAGLANMLADSTVADAAPASRRPSSCFNQHPGRPCICVQRGVAYNFSLIALGATAALLSAVRGHCMYFVLNSSYSGAGTGAPQGSQATAALPSLLMQDADAFLRAL